MQDMKNLLAHYQIKKSKISNKRQMLIKDFVDELNLERVGTKYKPLTSKIVAIKLGHLSEFDLEAFLSICRDYKNRGGSFSKRWFGGLKEQKFK